ncbi:hypothetical protein EB796_003802 [Bugula neritina]|uniref:Uncharacterized protein n=1 Tax=Bugula neritina TaxID=10212 RepID=A0A7J7KIY8_BUGNE|nr:hypothetical protein EB796_003802 [Bugula neritina]
MSDTLEVDWLAKSIKTNKFPLDCDVEEYCYERLKTKTICTPTSCLDLLCLGHDETGVYTIYPTGHVDPSIDVLCDQKTDGGWMDCVPKNNGWFI